MNARYNRDKNAVVDQNIKWQPLSTCRPGATVFLLTTGNVAIKGQYKAGDTGVKGWYPMPNIPEDMK